MTYINIKPGSIVHCRNRQWVVLPSENEDLVQLRSLSIEDEITGIYRQLLEMKLETIESATFPLPSAIEVKDQTSAQLLIHAARLLLRSGAEPFRCLGRLSLRPRPYLIRISQTRI